MYDFDERRLAKLQALREAGHAPYPHNLAPPTHTTAAVLDLIGDRGNEALSADATTARIAGRLMFKREMGKAGFARIQDRSGAIQLFIRKNDLPAETFALWKKLDLGDHVIADGTLMRTRTGEPTVRATSLTLASKCIGSLPDKHKGATGPEFRYRQRYVDLFINSDSRAVFQRRSAVVRACREFFEARDFIEVETPMMQSIPGGAAARPFSTHHNALDIELFLRVAPELYLKRLVVGGLERVFEINRNFRNEGVSTRHNPEFTMLEFYQAYATWHDLMDMTEALVSGIAADVCGATALPFGDHIIDYAAPWRRLPMEEALSEGTGLSVAQLRDADALRARWLELHPDEDSKLPTTVGGWLEWFFDELVQPTLIQPTFITHYPAEISPLARRSAEDPYLTERFELFVAGNELANGFNELNDPEDQAARFAAQVAARDAGDDEAMYFDADYVRALTYGLPPTAGEGIGIDRLIMLLTNRTTIRDVILFPTLRPAS